MNDAHQSASAPPVDLQDLIETLDAKLEAAANAFSELRSAVLRLKAEAAILPAPAAAIPASFDDASAREQVRLAVERARREMSGDADAGVAELAVETETAAPVAPSEPAGYDLAAAAEEWMRELGNEVEVDAAHVESNGASDADPASRREEVRQAVEQARAELESGAVAFDNEPPSADDEAVRDEVRRAVEQARAELFSGGLSMFDESAPPESDGLLGKSDTRFDAFKGADVNLQWPAPQEPEPNLMPASIVIEDEDGRVELARVYDTLNRVDRSQAALLNYSPHSVTVGLGLRDRLPDSEVMRAAVLAAFGRTCRVNTDGARMSVKIGEREDAA
jgi:hypothetical protein